MTDGRVSAIILAGGRSSRFGQDKLVAMLDGRRLIDHAIRSVHPFASEVLVVVAPDATLQVVHGVTVVRDDVAFGGPLVGLLAGLREARYPAVLALGGDMPTLQPDVARSLLDRLVGDGVNGVVLEEDGRARPLPLVLRREAASVAAGRLVGAGERRLRALVEELGASIIPETEWRPLDPAGRSLRDIDEPADLD